MEMPPEEALAKCRERWADFHAAGWVKEDLIGRADSWHGHHGLAWYLRPHNCIGRVWEWCAEILGRPFGAGERARTYYYKQMPLSMLRVVVGPHVIPEELR